MNTKCPICEQYIKNSYCPTCGLPKTICEWRLNLGIPTVYKPIYFHRHECVGFGLRNECCDKCDTPGPSNAKYCRSCGEKMHECVDLGLSVLWSTKTISYKYRWMDDNLDYVADSLSKDYDWDFNGMGKDISSELWGPEWRIPTKKECEELIQKCKWEKVIIPSRDKYKRNQRGFKVTGPNGNNITIPISRTQFLTQFWTTTEHPKYAHAAYCLSLDCKEEKSEDIWLKTPIEKLEVRGQKRRFALNIRPVADKKWQGKL